LKELDFRFCCKINIAVEEPSPFFRNLKEHLHIFSKSIFISFKNLRLSLQILLRNILIPYLFILLPKRDCPLNLFMQQDQILSPILILSLYPFFIFKNLYPYQQ